MYLVENEGLGLVSRITPTRSSRLRSSAVCPGYISGEKDRSKTLRGHLDPDVRLLSGGRLLIADFIVNWRSVRNSTKEEKLLRDMLKTFDTDSRYRLRILGYSDCVGREKNNKHLRRGRALRVYRLLGRSARSRVSFKGAASPGTYITGNTTPKGRAMNRGVVIKFQRNIPSEKVKVKPPRVTSRPVPRPSFKTPLRKCEESPAPGIKMPFPHIRSKRPHEWSKAIGACNDLDRMSSFKKYYQMISLSAHSSVLGLDRRGNLQLGGVQRSFLSLLSEDIRKKAEDELWGKAKDKMLTFTLGKELANIFGWALMLKDIYDKVQNRKLAGGVGREWDRKRFKKKLSMLMDVVAHDLARKKRANPASVKIWLWKKYRKYESILNKCSQYREMERWLRTGHRRQPEIRPAR